jgi:predicted  nucleic acid-binding Zn-ribbon protein
MLEAIEKLLVLQDCDQKLITARAELEQIGPRRDLLNAKAKATQSGLEAAKLAAQKIESERKRLELEVDSQKERINKYATQQLQTKKNEEYRALANEIENCKGVIRQLEDQQLELMEQAEGAARKVVEATKIAKDLKAAADTEIANLAKAETELNAKVAGLEAERAALVAAVEPDVLNRYERLLRNKGNRVVVGIEHGVCGGCHMKFPHQITVTLQAGEEVVTCPNCARILYYTQDMSLVVAD